MPSIIQNVSASVTDPEENYALRSKTIPTIAVIGDILANSYFIWFLLPDYPAKCARFAAETAVRQTCGLETGAYVITTLSAAIIFGGNRSG